MASKGGKRIGAGRKPKADEARIRDLAVSAIEKKYGSMEEGFTALLNTKDSGLMKWVFEHAAGKPKENVDITTNGNDITNAPQEVIIRDYSKKK